MLVINRKLKFIFFAFGLITMIGIGVKNRFDRSDLLALEQQALTMYDDRLMAERYIFQISNILYQKQLLHNIQSDAKPVVLNDPMLNNQLTHLALAYENTKFTREEDSLYIAFKGHLQKIQNLEKEQSTIEKANLNLEYERALLLLNSLSLLQIKESNKLNTTSKKIVLTNQYLSQLELILLIVSGLILLFLLNLGQDPQRSKKHFESSQNLN